MDLYNREKWQRAESSAAQWRRTREFDLEDRPGERERVDELGTDLRRAQRSVHPDSGLQICTRTNKATCAWVLRGPTLRPRLLFAAGRRGHCSEKRRLFVVTSTEHRNRQGAASVAVVVVGYTPTGARSRRDQPGAPP